METDIYKEDLFKKIDEEVEELDKFLEELYEFELYQDASLYQINKQLKNEEEN